MENKLMMEEKGVAFDKSEALLMSLAFEITKMRESIDELRKLFHEVNNE